MKLSIKTIQKMSKISNSPYNDFKIEFLYHSNKLEGSTFSNDIVETKNSLELFDKVINSLEEPFDKYLLWEWHRILKKGTVDDEIGNIGHWKKYSNMLTHTNLKLCEPNLVDNSIYNLIEDFKDHDKNIETIANFHQKFEHIHPFQDGNGRIGRFIILRQCIEYGIDLIAIDNEYNKEYRESLYIAQTTNDISRLVEVFKKCQTRLDEKLQRFTPFIKEIENEM